MGRNNNTINPLTPNDHYSGRTAPLTYKRCILYIYSTSIGIEYFKHGIYSSFFFSTKCSFFHNSNVFGPCIIHILYTGVLKLKKNNSGAKRLRTKISHITSHMYISTVTKIFSFFYLFCILYNNQPMHN